MFLLSALSITLPNTPTVRHTECPFSRDDQAGSFVTLTTAQRGVLAPPQRPTTGDTWKAMAAEGETVGQGQHRALFHSPSASLCGTARAALRASGQSFSSPAGAVEVRDHTGISAP